MRTLPLLRKGVDWCGVVAAAALLLLLTAMPAVPALAEDDPYSITVSVDATSDTIGKARDQARADGERKAFAALLERLSGASAAAKAPKLDDNALADLVASFEVANERMSAVRYVGDITFHFRPTEVQRVLQKAGIALANEGGVPDASAKSLVMIPVYQSGSTAVLWEDPNPWRDAWAQSPPMTGPAAPHLALPLGDAGDLAAIDAAKARAGDVAALTAIAMRNGGNEAIVAVAVPRGPPAVPIALDIAVRRYRAGQMVDDHADSVASNPGETRDQLFRRAVAAITGDIESGWKKGSFPRYDQQGSLTAVLPITGLDDWVRVRDRLAALPAIRKVSLAALSLQEATIEIEYLGTIDQLKASLAEAKLDLIRGEPQGASPQPGASPQGAPGWRLARSSAPAAPQ
ncbi:MAG: DUF2066 domain-containing protein [Alphaproteobacteria bacterium]|nr:DUF2066 domain-containing protein [Alphaproteobacteria bacterium]MBV9153184.1 DUF2066 domain-containing protein [Alphaproteobacteria bacterium]